MKHEHCFYYYPSTNESGWICGDCDLEPGFSPELDREHIDTKVLNILSDLHEDKLFYVPNASAGDAIAAEVVKRCKREHRYDQYSIIQFIFDTDRNEHAKYWAAARPGSEHVDQTGTG